MTIKEMEIFEAQWSPFVLPMVRGSFAETARSASGPLISLSSVFYSFPFRRNQSCPFNPFFPYIGWQENSLTLPPGMMAHMACFE